jgi:hypothetical protein
MKCNITADYVEITYETPNGITREKVISMTDFVKALSSSVKMENFSHFLAPGTRFVSKKGDTVYIGVEFGPCVREMKHAGHPNAVTPLPGGFALITAKEVPSGYAFSSLCIHALKGPITGPDTQLYDWPGANIGSSGGVCLGRNSSSIPISRTYKQLGDIWWLFFEYIANNDMSTNRFTPYKGVSHPQLLYLKLQEEGAKEFPLEILRPTVTVGEFMKARELTFNV